MPPDIKNGRKYMSRIEVETQLKKVIFETDTQ